MGNPVALLASADDRLTRGFISMMTMSPLVGSSANCTFDPPVSTPTRRMQANAALAHLPGTDVGERLGRDRDRVAGVDAHRVEVLDRADDHAVVGAVAHDLELVLLPICDRPLDEDLADGAGVEAVGRHAPELVGGGDAGALAAEDERGADHHRQPIRSMTAIASSRLWAVAEAGTLRPMPCMAP